MSKGRPPGTGVKSRRPTQKSSGTKTRMQRWVSQIDDRTLRERFWDSKKGLKPVVGASLVELERRLLAL